MNAHVRTLFSSATLALLVFYGWTFHPAPLVWGLLAVMCLVYQAMIWAHESWWNRPRYAVAVGLALALALAVSLFDGGQVYASVLLIPPFLLLAREQGEHRHLASSLAAAMMVTMLAVSRLAPFAFTLLPGVLTLYVCIRAINIYKDAHRLSQRHLEALDAAHRELQQMHAELQEASVHSMRYAALVERTRLAREVHDGLGHQLTSLIVQLQALEIMLPNDPQRAAGEIPAMLDVARAAMVEVRHAVGEWRENESGLGAVALQGLVSQTAARSHLAVEYEQQGSSPDWSADLSVALYRIVQEALTNIMRHASATSAIVRLEQHDEQVILTVTDNGDYTSSMQLSPDLGLRGIMERSRALGGSFELSQNRPHGLIVRVMLPIDSTVEDGVESGVTPATDWRAAIALRM